MPITSKKSDIREFLSKNKHSFFEALFFTTAGILINLKSPNPLLSLNESIKKLHGTIECVYVHDGILIIKCELDFTSAELLKRDLCVLPIKALLAKINPIYQRMLLKAYHWIQWDEHSRFCSKCGNLLSSQFLKPEKKCTNCHQIFYPRFSPAVLVLIQKKDKILLARSPHFLPGVYSVIAGFVDVGETAEMTVHREVTEELGIKVGKLQYFRSQTWPFPDSFMIAFKTTYLRGKITINTEELEDARWFDIDKLPKLPNKASISRKLIDSVIQK